MSSPAPGHVSGLPRALAGIAAGAAGVTLLTVALLAVRDAVDLAEVSLLMLVPVLVAAAIGGVRAGLPAAIAADLAVNFFFVPPYHTFRVERREHIVALAVYVLVASSVSVAVDLAARQRARAARREIEARLLGDAGAAPVAADSLERLLGDIRNTFGMTTVALLESGPAGELAVASVGPADDARPRLSAPAGAGLRLVAWGPEVFAEDRRTLQRMAAVAARTLHTQRIAAVAARADELAEVDRIRAVLLAAVGHDLRTPLAGVKLAVSSLRQADARLSAEQQAELLATIEASADELAGVIDNLLSLSRLEAGALSVESRAVALDGIVAQAVLATPLAGVRVEFAVPEDLPLVSVDPGLLERVVCNVLNNAVAVTPPAGDVLVTATRRSDGVRLSVVDRGPGVPAAERTEIFEPFRRRDDRSVHGGLGLGLAIAKGFTEAMGGRIAADETPGGGLTVVITLPLATAAGRAAR